MIVWNKNSKDILITNNKINNCYIFYSIINFSTSEHKMNIELKKEIEKIMKELGKMDIIDIIIF